MEKNLENVTFFKLGGIPVDSFFNTNFTLVNFVAEGQPGEL